MISVSVSKTQNALNFPDQLSYTNRLKTNNRIHCLQNLQKISFLEVVLEGVNLFNMKAVCSSFQEKGAVYQG